MKEKPNFFEKLELLKEKYLPFGEKNPLLGIPYEIKEYKPMDWNFQGMPDYPFLRVIAIPTFIILAAVYAFIQVGFFILTPVVFLLLAVAAMIFIGLPVIWVAVDSHRAAFNMFRWIIRLYLRRPFSLQKKTIETEMRVLDVFPLWPLTATAMKKALEWEEEAMQEYLPTEVPTLEDMLDKAELEKRQATEAYHTLAQKDSEEWTEEDEQRARAREKLSPKGKELLDTINDKIKEDKKDD